ncbi:hemolysin III family protein [Bizionia paragorgiae]|uniref:PAQR family membrane homeostasis protein TrhA n=1 Tax=Bizionia paragorgiae TaxID=283786 RepID=UPI00299D4448|nr:hemolysin III family protein [Bizionia paragorgiae]MDX1272703.1 hemolysin III family protein [Bizionia paragorgiae]
MHQQSPFEEKLNTLSHGITAILGVIGLVFLIIKNSNKTDWSLFSVLVYGCSIIILFTASTLYHYEEKASRKHYYRILDHISIYFLIAGTYTPVVLISLSESLGWPLFYAVWGIALFGVILKLFFTGRFEVFSTLLYLVMGWLVVFDFKQLSELMDPNGLLLLAAGGAAYTLGIVFYSVNKIPYNHVIWHFFVSAGAIFHYFMVYFYVI